MPQAARVTDPTAHGTPLSPGPGSSNVLIGNLAAWRAVPAAVGAGIEAAQTASSATLKGFETATLTAAAAVPPVALPAAETAETAARAAASLAMTSMIQSAASACGADVHNCAEPYVPVPPTPTPPSAAHGPGVVIDGCPTVMINNLPACYVGNTIIEALGPPDSIALGCPTVMICGPGGPTLGNPVAANAACQNAAAGRNPSPGTGPANTTKQSYNNCGVESSRQIINRANNSNVSQETLLTQSMANGDATQVTTSTGATNWTASGGTIPSGQVNILQNNGVPAHTAPANMTTISNAVAAGQGVIVQIDAAPMWNSTLQPGQAPTPAGAWHAVTVTGLEYDARGNVIAVVINDTGDNPPNNCQKRVPIGVFQGAMNAYQAAPGAPANSTVVTNNKVW